jgi:hypothetical protein
MPNATIRMTLSRHSSTVKDTHHEAALRRGIDLLRQSLAAEDTPKYRADLAEALAALAESEPGPAAREHVAEAVALLQPLHGQENVDPYVRESMDIVQRIQRSVHARR